MLSRSYCVLTALLACVWALPAVAQQSPSFYKEVRPILAKYCVHCHNGDEPKGGLDLTSYEELTLGGNSGDVIVPGKPDESLLVQLVLKRRKPHMPPKGEPQPRPEEIELIRRWIAAGARDDTEQASGELVIPTVAARVQSPPPVTALALSGDGKLAAAAVHKEVVLFLTGSGSVWGRLGPFEHPVSALAISPDRKLLAVAYGLPTREGKIAVFRLGDEPLYRAPKPAHVFDAHRDLIYDLAFRPSAPYVLASCSYDKLVKLWDCKAWKHIRDLKDHSDAVYGIAWSPDGTYLATAAADRTVKIWHVDSGRRLYSLTESTDWLYAVAWHPQKNLVAAAGVDKSIRVWEVRESEGRIVASTFAHAAPIVALAYSNDGKWLYTASEDGQLKVWDAEQSTEQSLVELGETPYDLALLPAGKTALVSLYDGRIVRVGPGGQPKAWAAADLLKAPLPKPPAPAAESVAPKVVSRGATVELTIRGKKLQWTDAVFFPGTPRDAAKILRRSATELVVRLAVPDRLKAGKTKLLVAGEGGQSSVELVVVRYPIVAEAEPNNSRTRAQKVDYRRTVAGGIATSGDVDFYKLRLRKGQEVGLLVRTSEIGSELAPYVRIYDPDGRPLARAAGATIGFRADKEGDYTIEVQDAELRGGKKYAYYLAVGDLPVVTEVFPLGVPPESVTQVEVRGVNLGADRIRLEVDSKGRKPGDWIGLPIQGATPVNPPRVKVGQYRQLLEAEDSTRENVEQYRLSPLPGTVDGRIEKPGDVDYYVLEAKAGETWVIEVEAATLGSRLDSYLTVLDEHFRPVPRALLRCLAQTYTTFNDRNSRQTGFRIEAWSELAVNDYVYVGDELLRIVQLPRNPDDDVRFFSFAGQRIAYLDTTPSYKPMGTPMYKVEIHPPDASLPPNGMPQFTLYFRNDDAGPPYRPDSRVYFDVPRDGRYIVAIGDVRGEGGQGYAYRLHVRPPAPSFNVRLSPANPQVWRGGSVPISITCERIDRFMGDVTIHFVNVPDGFVLPDTVVLAETYDMSVPLYAAADAKPPAKNAKPITAIARATINGKAVEKRVNLGRPRPVDPGDIVTAVASEELVINPGSISRLKVTIERRNGFKGRVPLDVRGLPHGVRVLDVGLNGILITERETERVVRFYAEPWTRVREHWFGIYARREGKNTLHGAKPILLKVQRKEVAKK